MLTNVNEEEFHDEQPLFLIFFHFSVHILTDKPMAGNKTHDQVQEDRKYA